MPVTDVLDSTRQHLVELLAWEPYAATPDYDARPEPTHQRLSVPVLTPTGPAA